MNSNWPRNDLISSGFQPAAPPPLFAMAQRILRHFISAERPVRTRRRDERRARGVDLANLVFEPPASRGSAIQTEFCRPSPLRMLTPRGETASLLQQSRDATREVVGFRMQSVRLGGQWWGSV